MAHTPLSTQVTDSSDLDVFDEYGCPLLWQAVAEQNLEKVGYLLSSRNPHSKKILQNINAAFGYGYGSNIWYTSPLEHAAMLGNIDLVKLLLKAGAQYIASKHTGYTPLMYAAGRGHVELAEYLLSSANPKRKETIELIDATGLKDGSSALFKAAANGNLNIFKLLQAAGADYVLYQDGTTPLWGAAQKGEAEMIAYLLSPENPQLAKVKQFIDATWEKNDTSALYLAAERGPLDAVQALLKEGKANYKACKDGTTPLWVAADNDQLDVVEYLLSNKNPQAAKVKALINSAWTKTGFTALHNAALKGNLPIVKALVQAGADLKAKCESFKAQPIRHIPFGIAFESEHQEVAAYLLSAACEPKAKMPLFQPPVVEAEIKKTQAKPQVQTVMPAATASSSPYYRIPIPGETLSFTNDSDSWYAVEHSLNNGLNLLELTSEQIKDLQVILTEALQQKKMKIVSLFIVKLPHIAIKVMNLAELTMIGSLDKLEKSLVTRYFAQRLFRELHDDNYDCFLGIVLYCEKRFSSFISDIYNTPVFTGKNEELLLDVLAREASKEFKNPFSDKTKKLQEIIFALHSKGAQVTPTKNVKSRHKEMIANLVNVLSKNEELMAAYRVMKDKYKFPSDLAADLATDVTVAAPVVVHDDTEELEGSEGSAGEDAPDAAKLNTATETLEKQKVGSILPTFTISEEKIHQQEMKSSPVAITPTSAMELIKQTEMSERDKITLRYLEKFQQNRQSLADGSALQRVMLRYLGGEVEYIHPDLVSNLGSPFDVNEDKRMEVALRLAKEISGYIHSDGVFMPGLVIGGKPIIAIFNTSRNGSHWILMCIMPGRKPGEKPRIFFLDPLVPHQKRKESIVKVLREGGKENFTADVKDENGNLKIFTHEIIAGLPDLEEVSIPKQFLAKQIGPRDCGWRALFYALSIITTGGIEQLCENRDNITEEMLRELFPDLDLDDEYYELAKEEAQRWQEAGEPSLKQFERMTFESYAKPKIIQIRKEKAEVAKQKAEQAKKKAEQDKQLSEQEKQQAEQQKQQAEQQKQQAKHINEQQSVSNTRSGFFNGSQVPKASDKHHEATQDLPTAKPSSTTGITQVKFAQSVKKRLKKSGRNIKNLQSKDWDYIQKILSTVSMPPNSDDDGLRDFSASLFKQALNEGRYKLVIEFILKCGSWAPYAFGLPELSKLASMEKDVLFGQRFISEHKAVNFNDLLLTQETQHRLENIRDDKQLRDMLKESYLMVHLVNYLLTPLRKDDIKNFNILINKITDRQKHLLPFAKCIINTPIAREERILDDTLNIYREIKAMKESTQPEENNYRVTKQKACEAMINMLQEWGASLNESSPNYQINKDALDEFLGQTITQKSNNSPTDSRNALYEAAAKGDLDTVKKLLNSDDVKYELLKTTTPLLVAAKNSHVAVVEYLLSPRNPQLAAVISTIDFPGENGFTALHFAAWNGNEAIVKALVEAMANFAALCQFKNDDGEIEECTPLDLAMYKHPCSSIIGELACAGYTQYRLQLSPEEQAEMDTQDNTPPQAGNNNISSFFGGTAAAYSAQYAMPVIVGNARRKREGDTKSNDSENAAAFKS